MGYTPVETIALILIVFAVVKTIFLIASPSVWMKIVKKTWTNPAMMRLVALVLAAIVLFFLLDEITIVQIMAVTAFVVLLAIVGLASEAGFFIKKCNAQIGKKSFWKEYWIYALIWLVLIVWAGKELFM